MNFFSHFVFGFFRFKNFQRSSILNFPPDDKELYDITIDNNAKYIHDDSYYSSITEINRFRYGKFWHIKTSKDFKKLIEDINNNTIYSRDRTINELFDLLNFIIDEDIKLFITRDNKDYLNMAGELIYSQEIKSIVINCAFIHNIDLMCRVLTHELIHYFQIKNYALPLNLEISDSIVSHVIDSYQDADNLSFQMELEAFTYERYPNFILEYKKKRRSLQRGLYPSKFRKETIRWICKNRKIPNYSSNLIPTKILNFPIDNKKLTYPRDPRTNVFVEKKNREIFNKLKVRNWSDYIANLLLVGYWFVFGTIFLFIPFLFVLNIFLIFFTGLGLFLNEWIIGIYLLGFLVTFFIFLFDFPKDH